MSEKPVVIKFFAPVAEASVNALMNAIDNAIRNGTKEFILLISTLGGTVFHGLSAYNYLKGLPVSIKTHNFGSVDSMGVVLYCAGEERFSSPQARFLLHGVSANFPQGSSLEEKQLEERLKALQLDIENIAKVVAANIKKDIEEVVDAMVERTTLNPDEAKSWGLVHEIKTELFEEGSPVISIMTQPQQSQK